MKKQGVLYFLGETKISPELNIIEKDKFLKKKLESKISSNSKPRQKKASSSTIAIKNRA